MPSTAVLTFRLRPATVGRAVLAGMTGEEMVDVIGRVGCHGIPAGVRAQVLDWATNARVASAAPVTLLRVAARLHDEVVAALGDLVVSAPAPGVVLVAEGEPLETIRARLAASNVEVAGRAAPHDGRGGAGPLEPGRARDRPTAPAPRGDQGRAARAHHRRGARRRASRRAWRRAATSSPRGTTSPTGTSSEPARSPRRPRSGGSSRPSRDSTARTGPRSKRGWRGSPEERGALDPMSVVPLLMIPPAHRRRILSGGAPVDEVLAEAGAVMKRGWLSVEGKKLAKAMRGADPEQLAEMLFGDEDDDESDLADEELEPPREAPTMTRGRGAGVVTRRGGHRRARAHLVGLRRGAERRHRVGRGAAHAREGARGPVHGGRDRGPARGAAGVGARGRAAVTARARGARRGPSAGGSCAS
ncbi:MAG: hypothetical protein M5U28_55445 [Sandaracinaceae bacterium]|nr:hypothetical protein [Sandaracinaceae bacterium]